MIMDKITNAISELYKPLILALMGVCSFFLIDVHRMVKGNHDAIIVYKEQIETMGVSISELKEKDKDYELLFRKLLTILPNNDFDVSYKEKQGKRN